ncbi:MAG: metal-dependent transcriptional regulator [Candidatus Methanomethylophilaceae archaeon]|jgi:DtxR family Mn-dependent transcriptional regulator|nr:metal-dependent transcriptional regulator [Candidatus Methanomethylophilaceae archaeon]
MATENREDYLISILRLTEGKGAAKTTELAEFMGVSPASVSEMVKVLSAEGYVKYEKYRGMALTEKGLIYARQIRKKHHVLERFLTDYLDVDHKTAHDEAGKMEHAISDESAIKMCRMMGPRIDEDCCGCSDPCKTATEGIVKITPLEKMPTGSRGYISHVLSNDSAVVKKLVMMGFVPGKEVIVETAIENGPQIIKMGDSSVAVDSRYSSCIFVDAEELNVRPEGREEAQR